MNLCRQVRAALMANARRQEDHSTERKNEAEKQRRLLSRLKGAANGVLTLNLININPFIFIKRIHV